MKKRLYLKSPRKNSKYIFKLIIVITVIQIIFKIINKSPIKINDQQLVKILLQETNLNITKKTPITKLKSIIKKTNITPEKLLLTTQYNILNPNISEKVKPINQEIKPPLIYIYNTHQTEEYSASNILEYSIKPTVMMANYILEETFNKNNYHTIVEERSIKEILNSNNWKYANSYKASRILMESSKNTYPSIKYFIDIHRDSLTKEKTTIEINNKKYAKILFLIGLENPTYQSNLNFTEEINKLLNEKYPNLSKGIYKKSGPGVNGIYNQDFSPYVILVEMGGYENTPEEVMNSTLAFAECFMEVIKKYES